MLDLEGNDVDDLVQVQYLGFCGKLQTLTLEGNPVCVRPNPTADQVGSYFANVFHTIYQIIQICPHGSWLSQIRFNTPLPVLVRLLVCPL